MTSGRGIALALGGVWRSRRAMCRCPAHDDKTPSLSVSETRDGRPLVHCFTGCKQSEVIDALRARGLWEGEAKVDPSYPGFLTQPHDGLRDRDERDRQKGAEALWERADRAHGTVVETYLRSRGITVPIPDDIGFLPKSKHGPSATIWPCMIAAMRDAKGNVQAVQRTWLTSDGKGKAPVAPVKMTYGPMGFSAVRLGPASEMMGLAEGIETALSARQLYRIPVWATLSAHRLSRVALPACVRSLVIFADAGEVGMNEALLAAEHFEGRGIDVDVMPPSVNHDKSASDFNDVVRGHA